mmetsp:Transcript_44000/g.71594  ORF Transcript_44000/g.71594 Transcript_44000/m.71594 type:complete len:349 (-) Transcript_44000:239-1285(-)|eukprot:CAMPEP_0184654022 /NCGR_PEP_ID=MMETSP0308-20130426/11726_1 /TAXON_ID=38269 /ORGANISM="Gloeochaete witrockiana, Strain SAG 46.84" /LENGTH=348 /DNA_ID=CAMNT_0027089813 /DNA_START=107 /DNA_END=1153 /DNA_ORIENTATION=+
MSADPFYVPNVVLVTGGAGFVGSNIVLRLVKNPKIHVINLDNLGYSSCIKNLSEIEHLPNYTFVQGDICNLDFIAFILRSKRIDTIIHCACQTHVDETVGNSIGFTQVNVIGTHTLLEAAKAFSSQLKRFIYVSSDEVYGNTSAVLPSLDETTDIGPTHPYAATKAAAELIVQAYYLSFHLPLITVRLNNCYGPLQHPEKVIPKFILRLLRNQPLFIHGMGENIRSFLYIDDVVDAFMTTLYKGSVGETYNIGAKDELTVLQIAKLLLALFHLSDQSEKYLQFVPGRPFPDQRHKLDYKKLAALGWEPKTTFEQGMKTTIEWYKAHFSNWGVVVDAALSSAHPKSIEK